MWVKEKPSFRPRPLLREALWCLANGQPLRPGEGDGDALRRMLFHVQGCREGRFRTVPSAGATYPLEVYVSSRGEVFRLERGLYRYVPCGGGLSRVGGDAGFEGFVLTAFPGRTTTYYGERGYRYVRMELGHALQNLFLSIYSHGLAGSVELVDYEFRAGSAEYVLARVAVSRPAGYCAGFALEKGLPLDDVVAARRSVRNYARASLGLEALDSIMKWSMGEVVEGARPYPKLGGGYAVEGYVVATSVKGVEKGLYRFNSSELELELVRVGEFAEKLWRAALMQGSVRKAPAVVVLTGRGPLAEVEVGAVGQNIYLNAVHEGLGTVAIGAFEDEEVSSILEVEDPLYLMPVGKPA
ncbi:SagB/ThcOx family dehydrogenase [Thermofilum pendens]|uniref:Nitroreductase domain-containing protein n=1 Tax=Thermofilum pendens (strain DSM 2475 / Hrk 5) TaxID=368408 RepID=A1RYN6_THEPD|nr:nitroreductase family protein [Thermofilum pendens]ABL78316.1 hypothetical protein Tpen_0915 [Thermofilum pendens Hrk 5]